MADRLLTSHQWSAEGKPRVLILGGGFAGLAAARALRRADCEILLLDRQNHHLFQPLLYQVATAGLSGSDIAQPLRAILASQRNAQVHMATAASVDLAARHITVEEDPGLLIQYDHIVLAIGAQTNWLGHPEWAQHAIGLKNLSDAYRVRDSLLFSIERAENMLEDTPERRRLLTAVIVGGGPTGVEMAGAIAELARRTVASDFRIVRPDQIRVVLIDGSDRLLKTFAPDLSERALRDLRELGVEVHLGARVREVRSGAVLIEGVTFEAGTIIWAAGVSPPRLLAESGAPVDRSGRIPVGPDCRVPGFVSAYAVGDAATITDASGAVLPGVAQTAMQSGGYAGRSIAQAIVGRGALAPFRYRDKGSMATIGRTRAVAQIGRHTFAGVIAWLLWLAVHLMFLVHMTSRVIVLIKWAAAYLYFNPMNRVILSEPVRPEEVSASRRPVSRPFK